jgi:hypothetical protein
LTVPFALLVPVLVAALELEASGLASWNALDGGTSERPTNPNIVDELEDIPKPTPMAAFEHNLTAQIVIVVVGMQTLNLDGEQWREIEMGNPSPELVASANARPPSRSKSPEVALATETG